MTAEIAYNQGDFAYRKEPGVNQSSLKKILDSPAHYQAALKNKLIPTPAMQMGTAAHCLVLMARGFRWRLCQETRQYQADHERRQGVEG